MPEFDITLLGFSGLKEFFNIHPVLVHFPIALLPAALLLLLAGKLRGNSWWNQAGIACLWLGVAGGAGALWSGLEAETSIPHNDTIHHMMQTHETLGWSIVIGGGLLVLFSLFHRPMNGPFGGAFLSLLFVTALLTFQNADIGGRMVYLEGAGVKPAVQVIAPGQPAASPVSEPPRGPMTPELPAEESSEPPASTATAPEAPPAPPAAHDHSTHEH